MNGALVKKTITYTHTLPSGAVVVILGVPALCDEENEDDFCAFEPEVSERLYDLIDAAAARNPAPGEVVKLLFSDDPETVRPQVDLEVRVRGKGLNFGEIPLSALERLVESTTKAYRIAAKAVAKRLGVSKTPPYPTVAFVAPGSVVLGLRSSGSTPLFEEADVGHMALDLILQGVEWAGEGAPPGEDPELVAAALESVIELGKQEGVVELARYGEGGRQWKGVITPELRAKGEERLREVVREASRKSLQVFEGLLDAIKLDGEAHLRELSLKPQEYTGTTLNFRYGPDLLPKLLELFGKRVRLAAEEKAGPGERDFQALEVEGAKELPEA